MMAHQSCHHRAVLLSSSTHSEQAGYKILTDRQRATAAGKSAKAKDVKDDSATFPGPLVLPDDDLALDPRYPPQSFRSWVREKERNEVTKERNVVYVVPPPKVEAEVSFLDRWKRPAKKATVDPPRTRDVVGYLKAFYYGMEIKILEDPQVSFTSWEAEDNKSKTKKGTHGVIGLQSTTECVRIRTRSVRNDIFPGQLNLNDLLDMAIGILPEDAYALLMLVDQDLYEDDDDDFACGRAYGGSRVAVVSSARYNPTLDQQQNVEREHAWPASHCNAYVNTVCDDEILQDDSVVEIEGVRLADHSTDSAIVSAIIAHAALPLVELSSRDARALSGMWLARVCRTASHELGHCFGIDHCVYYACAMQGTASLSEDIRQPPYLCPVDLAKVLRATNSNELERYNALLLYCEGFEHIHLFASFSAWIRKRI